MSIHDWPDAIESVLARCTTLRTLTLLRETASTQDAARASGAPIGRVVVAGRQTQGRGRLGRAWQDTGDQGVAMTCVVPRADPERLAMLSAVAVAEAVLVETQFRACIKWPNDIMVGERKLGGVLVEQGSECAWIGVGINVLQEEFLPPLDATAISMVQAGANPSRLQVVLDLIRSLDEMLQEPTPIICQRYLRLEQTTGRHASFLTPGGPVSGTVITVDPEKGLVVATPEGMRFLPAATTSVVQLAP